MNEPSKSESSLELERETRDGKDSWVLFRDRPDQRRKICRFDNQDKAELVLRAMRLLED
jgi:hypothetical protein